MGMTDFIKKVRAMLDAGSKQIVSVRCVVSEGCSGKISFLITCIGGDRPSTAKLFAAAPTLLREACERIESLEELHEIVRWEKECEDFQRPPSRKFQTHLGHIPWLDAKKAKENWQSKGWRSLARIYGNAWMQKQDALSALDAKEQPNDQAD